MEKHVVVIFPHPDDEAFGTSGTIAKFREEGVPVTYLCGTLGEMGRNMGNPTFANRETLPEIRKKELIDACNILDIDLHMLGYRDKTLEFESTQMLAERLKGILDEIKPSLVITHYPGYAVHPDHNALGAAAIEAVRQMDEQVRPTVWAQAFSRDYLEDLGEPDVAIDISAHFVKKMETILAHQSQAGGMLKGMDKTTDNLEKIAKERLGDERFYTWKFDA